MSSQRRLRRVLIVGEHGVNTGFARVLRSLFRPMAARYALRQVAPGAGDTGGEWPVDYTPHGLNERVARIVDEFAPDVLFLLMSMDREGAVVTHLRATGKLPPTVAYCPVESGPLDLEIVSRFEGVAACVAFTRFGAAEINRAAAAAGVDLGEVRVIPHGVDTRTFRPLYTDVAQSRSDARRLQFPKRGDLKDAFIVLNANRNQPRKRVDITLLAFQEFAARHSGVALILHMEPEGRGWNVAALARQLGISDRVLLTGSGDGHRGSDAELNLLYNSANVGLNTATAEGWGLTALEHAATHAAQVLPRHTAFAEIWDGVAEFVEPVVTLVHAGALNREFVVAPNDVSSALERLYTNAELYEARSRAACTVANDPQYQWPAIVESWCRLFHEIVH